VRPKGHHCQGDESLGSDACPAEAETDAKMAIHQAADCIMLPGEGVGRGYRLCEGSQMGLCATGFNEKPQGSFPLITTAYRGVAPPGPTGSFREDDGMKLAWTTIALALTHPALPTRGRAQGRGATRRPTQTGCPPLLGHQLRSAPFPVQATDVSWNKAKNNTCAYVPTGGTTAEEALESGGIA